MPKLSFKGKNRQAQVISSKRVANRRHALALALRREQIFLMDAEEKKAGGFGNLEFGGNPTAKDIAVFTRQLSAMIDAGEKLRWRVSMIGVGEQAGALEMLTKIADFHEEEVAAAVGDLMTAMEPAIIVVLGIIVGGIVISMHLPIFTLVGKLSSK